MDFDEYLPPPLQSHWVRMTTSPLVHVIDIAEGHKMGVACWTSYVVYPIVRRETNNR